MASITATLEIVDNMTAPMIKIQSVATSMISSFDNMDSSINSGFNPDPIIDMYDEVSTSATKFNQMADEIDNATNSQKNFNNSLNQGVNAFSGLLQSIGVYTLINKAISTVSSSVDSAISRFDKLKNFPNIMQQMGYSALEAENSVNRLSDGITGLPTTLDDIVSSAQRITLITGNLEAATETALALNNAFYASGSSYDDASRGLTQYVQMLSKGKVDATSWLTLQETMGYALNETAAAFGYTGDSAQNDLYSALQEGIITFNDFNNKLIELSNTTGGFAEVALTATGGIGTAWGNLKNDVAKGVTGIMQSFDSLLANTSFGSLEGVIDALRGKVQDFFSKIKKVVDGFNMLIQTSPGLIQQIQSIGSAILKVVGAILMFNVTLKIISAAQSMWSLLTSPITWVAVLIMVAVFAVYKFAQAVADAGGVATTAFGVITGAIAFALATIGNLFIAAVNLIIDVLIIPYNFIADFANFLANVFTDPIGAVVRLFTGLADTVLGILESLASAIDTLFGSKLADAVSGWRSNLNSWVDDKFGAGVEIIEKIDGKNLHFDRLDPYEAYKSGAAWGDNLSNTLGDLFNGTGDFGLFSSVTEGLDAMVNAADVFNNSNMAADTPALPDTGAMGGGTEEDYLSSIDSNTSDIVSAVSNSSDEELKYLKEIAERLALSEATPVVVTVEMNNMQNTIGSSNNDIDGFINTLTTAVSDAVVSSAEGVHT